MTYKEAKEMFIEISRPFNDYYEMQLAWSCFVDGLCRDRTITLRQYNNWSNPCTIKTFKRFNDKLKVVHYNEKD